MTNPPSPEVRAEPDKAIAETGQWLAGAALGLIAGTAEAMPGWASGNPDFGGGNSWTAVFATFGFLALIGFDKELAAEHTPTVSQVVSWLGRLAAGPLLLALVLSPFRGFDPDAGKTMLCLWSVAKAAQALYLAGIAEGIRGSARKAAEAASTPAVQPIQSVETDDSKRGTPQHLRESTDKGRSLQGITPGESGLADHPPPASAFRVQGRQTEVRTRC